MPKPRAERAHADEVLKLVRARGLDHLRVVSRGDLLTIVSGDVDDDDPFAHARLRRISAKRWRLEMPSHARWQPTPYEGPLPELIATLVDAFGWTLAPLD